MPSSPFERLLTAGLKASNESRRQIEAALIRLVDPRPVAQPVEDSERVSELVEREVAREVGLRTDELVDRLDELETRLAEADLPEDEQPDDNNGTKKKHGRAKHGNKKHDGKKKRDKGKSTVKTKRSATSKRAATTNRSGASEAVAHDEEPVGASGVRRVPTTRSARNEG
jgi:hypothetical protein